MSKLRLILGNCLERMHEIPDDSINMVMCNVPNKLVKHLDEIHTHLHRVVKDNGVISLLNQEQLTQVYHLIEANTNEGETVLDFSMGSGLIASACIVTNRNFIGIEPIKRQFNKVEVKVKETMKSKREKELRRLHDIVFKGVSNEYKYATLPRGCSVWVLGKTEQDITQETPDSPFKVDVTYTHNNPIPNYDMGDVIIERGSV